MNKTLKSLIVITYIILIILVTDKLDIKDGFSSNKSSQYGVSSSNSIAVEVGMHVLKKGGNAVDAAVAISYVLGVVEPYGSGIGGGGGMMVYSPKENTSKFYDYREYAPTIKNKKTINTGIPGFVMGMEYIHNIYGKIELENLIDPAISYSKEGFRLNDYLYNRINFSKNKLNKSKLPQFFEGNKPKKIGSIIVQEDLANTLEEIQKYGADSFYNGNISKNLMNLTGWKAKDLTKYTVIENKAIKSKFEDYEIFSAPPPFSGATLIQILKLAEYLDINEYKYDDIKYIKAMSKIMNVAYKDRIKNIGDIKYKNINYQELVSDEYLNNILNVNEIEEVFEDEHESTTHFVVIDKDGMVVSCTNTLGDFFGSGDYIGGFFLNNTLSNFNYKDKNSINSYEVGKRPRTFMAPTIIKKEDFIMGIGSPGGNRIPQVMAQVIINNLIFKKSLDDSINENRIVFKGTYKITTEAYLGKFKEEKLKKQGYEINLNESTIYYGGIQAMVSDKIGVYGGADYRRYGVWDCE